MSDYKRLTERRGNLIIDKCANCGNVNNPQGCTDKICYEFMKSRLCELEDKIQQGLMLELPCILPAYYLCGEWHCKILKGFDNHSVPCMEYFHGTTKEEVEKKAEQKLKDLKGEVWE